MKTKFVRPVLLMLLGGAVSIACNAITGIDGFAVDPNWDASGGGGQAGAGGMAGMGGMGGMGGAGGTGGEGLGCTTELTCPGETNACQTRSCVTGSCQLVFEPESKLISGQTVGDCFRLECDGKGQVRSVVDTQDLPDDGLECTQDACGADGSPSHTPAVQGATCAQNGGQVCNGMGDCVQCNFNTNCSGGGFCVNGVCVPPECNDQTKNGNESDIDCGGSQCPPCGTGLGCAAKTDCVSQVCIAGTCRAPTCTDMAANGDETDIDCGGATCTADCADGEKCLVGNDCTSGVCMSGICQVPSCTDGIKNGNETDVDCGSMCPGCGLGLPCNVNNDCASEICRNGTCIGVVQVDVSTAHACALLGDGTVYCWGANGGGQIGDGTTTPRPAPVMVPGLTGITQISVGAYVSNPTVNGHSCARTNDGKLYCWGRNNTGQVGDGMAVDVLSPKLILGADVVQVAAGRAHTCARLTSGAVQCWGFNSTGQIGNGTMNNTSVPGPPIPNLSAKSIAAGGNHTCAVSTTGELSCWGGGASGQLGNGMTTNSLVPNLVPGTANMLAVDTGFGFTCSIDAVGALRCFGDNTFGELGLGNTTMQTTPQVVPDATNAVGITCGTHTAPGGHTCYVRADGALFCFGLNNQGQLGVGDIMDKSSPKQVMLPPVAEVAAGFQFTCARLVNGSVRCWGRNDASQLGTGIASTIVLTPVAVAFP